MIMSNLTKILLGTAAVVGVTCATAVLLNDKKEEKVEEGTVQKDITIEVEEVSVLKDITIEVEEVSVLKRIKKYVTKKVIKILAFVALHMEQIEAISTVIGLTTGVISIMSAVRDYRRGSDIQEKLDKIENLIIEHDQLCRDRINGLGTYTQECTKVVNSNLKIIDDSIIEIAENLKLDVAV